MLSDQFYDFVALAGLQKAANRYASGKAIASLLVIGVLAVVVDYLRMLWLRRKMVGKLLKEGCSREIDRKVAPWAHAFAHSRKYVHASRCQALVMVRGAVQAV